MFTRPAWGEVVNGGFQVRERCGAVSPDVGLMGFLLTRSQHADRRFIGVQNVVFQQGVSQRICQGLQLHTAGTDPFGECGTGYFQAGTAEDAFLTVQWQVVRVLGHQHLSQQAGGGDALVDHLRWYRCLDQGLALLAGPLAPDVPLHGELARDVIQLFAHVLANTLELAAAMALGIDRFMVDQGTGQLRWQRGALRLLLGSSGLLLLSHRLVQLGFDGGQVTVDQLVQELALNGIELLTAAGELVTFEDGDFVGQLLDDGIAAHQLPLLPAQGLILGVQGVHQFRRQSTELIG